MPAFVLDEHVDRAGDAEPAEQQRAETDQAEEAAQRLERLCQLFRLFGGRVEADRCAPEAVVVAVEETLQLDIVRNLQKDLVTGERAERQHAGRGQVAGGDEDARTERASERNLRRHRRQHAAHLEPGTAETDAVADRCAQLLQQRALEQCASALVETPPRTGRLRHEIAVERIRSLHRAHLHEPRATRRGQRHG
jgi:hypothetical protein